MKKRQPHQAADRFYDYLMKNRSQVLRYAVAALVTGLIQFFASRMLPLESGVLLMFLARIFLLFYACKYWVYKERETGFYYTARQLMLAVMLTVLLVWLVNQLILTLGNGKIVGYGLMAVQEVVIFLLHQFLIFRKAD